jgi:Flp pilus assembly pilin Flp
MWHRTSNGPWKCRRTQHGQAMTEYLLLVGIVAIVLFTPSPLTNNVAPADFLARAVRSFFRGYSFLISVF